MTRVSRRSVIAASTALIAGCSGSDDDRIDELESELNETTETLADVRSELNTTETELSETESELAEIRTALETERAQRVVDTYVYALSLADAGDRLYDRGVTAWDNQEFLTAARYGDRAAGLFSAAREAADETVTAIDERAEAWSGEPSDVVAPVGEYTSLMTDAATTLGDAARAAAREEFGDADELINEADDLVSKASRIQIPQVRDLEAEL